MIRFAEPTAIEAGLRTTILHKHKENWTHAGKAVWRTPFVVLAIIQLASISIAPLTHADGLVSVCPPGVGEATARRIQTRYEAIRDLSANFAQTNKSATFGGKSLMNTDRKTGKVVFAKPGQMRWTYEEPEASVVVSDGSTLWIHDVEANSVTKLAVTAGFLSGAALQFLLGDGQILESFDVKARSCDGGRIDLDLIPKAEATYERLGLLADPKTGDILATSVLDLFGNLTRIEFHEVQINLAPQPEIFQFTVPDGVEVLEYEGLPGG